MVVVGGRAPANRWGSGSLQELDQPPIVAPIAKSARTLHTAGDVIDGMHDAFTAAGSVAPRPGVRRRADGRVLQLRVRADARPSPGRRGQEPDGDAVAEVAELLASRLASGADPRHRRLGGRRRGGRAALRRVRAASPRSPTAWAAAWSPAATRCWSPRPAARRSAAATSSSWSAPRSTSGSGTASSAARTAPRRPRSCTSPTPPARSPATPSSPPRSPATSPRSSTACWPRSSRSSGARLVAPGSTTSRRRSRPRPSATPPCSAPRPTRSTRPGSTASWCRGWPTTRS